MVNQNIFDEEADKSLFSKFKGKFLKIPFKKKDYFEEYKKVNFEIMQIVNDIHDLKIIKGKKGDKIDIEIDALEYNKKILETSLIEIEQHFYDEKKGLWIGIAEDLESEEYESFLLYLPWKNIYNHFEVFGTSGYGKSRLMACLLRQIIKFGWSVMAVDPKGGDRQEVAQWIYDFAAEAGRNEHVVRIMPTFPGLSAKGNVIFGMDDDELCSLTSSLAVSSSGVVNSNEQFYSGQVYRTTNAILSSTRFLEKAAYTKSEIDQMLRNEVIKYRKMVDYKGEEIIYEDNENILPDMSSIITSEKAIFDENAKHLISPFTRTLITFRELSYYSTYDKLLELHSLVKDYPIKEENKSELELLKTNALRILEEVISKDKTFYEKVGDSLSILLSQLAFGPVGSIMCDIRINPLVQKIRDKEGVIIIFQPAPMRFEKISEMMIKCYMRMYLSLFGTIGASGRGINRRVAMIVDEAKPMVFPGIEEIYNKARQLGMTIGAFYQSRSDTKYKLGEVLADIVQDNTATNIFMKQVSETSRKECAESFGTKKVAVNVAMKENDAAGGRSTVVFDDRELVASTDMDELGIGEAYVKHYGKKYHVVFPYQKDPMKINVVMPKLESETLYERIALIESAFRSQENTIETYNVEVANSRKERQ